MTATDRERVVRMLAFDDDVDVESALRRFRLRTVRSARDARHERLVAGLAAAFAVLLAAAAASPLRVIAAAAFDRLVVARYVAADVSAQSVLLRFTVPSTIRRPVHAPCAATLAEASARAGFPVRVPGAMTQALKSRPCPFAVDPGWVTTWRLDVAVARRNGLTLPPALRDALLRIDTGPLVQMRSAGGTVRASLGQPVVVLDEGRDPALVTSGTTLAALLIWLRSEPALSPQERALVESFAASPNDWPAPLPSAFSRAVVVDGVSGVGYETPLKTRSAALWSANGLTYAAYGNVPLRDLLRFVDSVPEGPASS